MDIPKDDDAIVSLDGWRRRKAAEEGKCKHTRYVLNDEVGIVECRDCAAPVSAYHVLRQCALEENRLYRRLRAMRDEIQAIAGRRSWLKAVQRLDKIWRGRKMLPCCPHCRRGLFAEEMDDGAVGIDYEVALRKRDGARIPVNDAPDAATLSRPAVGAQTKEDAK